MTDSASSSSLSMGRLFPRISHFVLVLCLPWLGSGEPIGAEEGAALFGRGPIGVRDAFPLARVHLTPTPTTPELLDPGRSLFRIDLDWASIYTDRTDEFLFDDEERLLELSLFRGITDGVELGARVGYLWRGGGVLDSAVDTFHDTFGFPDGGRGDSPDDQYSVRGVTTSGTFAELEEGGSISNLVVHAKVRLYRDEERRVSTAVSGELSLPVARDEFGGDSLDGGLQLLGAWDTGRWNFFGGVGWTMFSDTHLEGFEFSKHRIHGFVTAEWEWTAWLSCLLQIQGANRLLQNIRGFPSVSSYIAVGSKWGLSERVELETTLVENLTDQDSTADVVFRIGLGVLF